jgi:SAM-dependent methyltransferase
MKMDEHWTEKLFIEEASLFGARLEEKLESTDEEIEGLLKIFSEHKVPKGGAILDLACGIGRHSTPLAEKGYKVTGVDISPTFIERARVLAHEKNVSKRVEFVVGDMRQVGELLKDREESFDVVVNLLTSHGYWDEETDREIFRQAYRLTKRDGIFIIHTANRDFLVRHFQARAFTFGKDGRVVIAERRLDLESSRMFNVWRYYEQRGDDLEHLSTFKIDHRVYSLHELKKQIEDSGWSFHSSYGGYDMKPLTTDTLGMILISKKSA